MGEDFGHGIFEGPCTEQAHTRRRVKESDGGTGAQRSEVNACDRATPVPSFRPCAALSHIASQGWLGFHFGGGGGIQYSPLARPHPKRLDRRVPQNPTETDPWAPGDLDPKFGKN